MYMRQGEQEYHKDARKNLVHISEIEALVHSNPDVEVSSSTVEILWKSLCVSIAVATSSNTLFLYTEIGVIVETDKKKERCYFLLGVIDYLTALWVTMNTR
jgi:hypothetical protein